MPVITLYKDGRILARQNITLNVNGADAVGGTGKAPPAVGNASFTELRSVEESWVRLTITPATADPGQTSNVTVTTTSVGVSVVGVSPLFSGATVTAQVFAVGF